MINIEVIKQLLGTAEDVAWCKIDHKKSSATFDGFCRALSVWINKPHVINRRLSGAQILRSILTEDRIGSDSISTRLDELFRENFNHTENKTNIQSDKITERLHSDSESLTVDVDNLDSVDSDLTVVIIRDLYPKQVDRYSTVRELIVLDKKLQTVIFCPVLKYMTNIGDEDSPREETHVVLENEISYRVTFLSNESNENSISLDYYCVSSHQMKTSDSIGNGKPESHLSAEWLKDVLLKKLCNWSMEANLRTGVTSLKLVPVDKYTIKYHQLKQKYGAELVRIWPENTDPQKFVYEDIAIATYLLLLWEEERHTNKQTDKQSFVDLGCGNGLLVYLLMKEGHPGLGLDLRRRKIWDTFGSSANLKETSITPSECSIFPDYDWLIGNHSDELTPWIPVMAARSSYTCRYFVLPCCLHDFDHKFNRKESGRSQYRTYLDFVMEVGTVCGFEVQEDTLRIPSTKRVCFVGQRRSYLSSEETSVDLKRTQYISQRCKTRKTETLCKAQTNNDSENDLSEPAMKRERLELPAEPHQNILQMALNGSRVDTSKSWAGEFQPRSNIEKVRNCRDVEKSIKEEIVNTVFEKVFKADPDSVKVTEDGRNWRKGGSVPLPEAASLFDKDVLQKLKSECGGIQTLLRNHHYIFQVTGGCVQLRDTSVPRPPKKTKKNIKKIKQNVTKTFLCWFNEHHPDGCPGTLARCVYAHGEEDIREKTQVDDS